MKKSYLFILSLLLCLAFASAEDNSTGQNLTDNSNNTIEILADNSTDQDAEPIVYNQTEDVNLTEENLTDITPIANITPITNITPTIICNETQCDKECVVCSDKKCHQTDFKCTEDIDLEKIIPSKIGVGASQINLLLKNKGNVDLSNIYAEISGDGIKTTSKIVIDSLPAGEKDYTFVGIESSKAGDIDLVLKIFVNNTLKKKLINQITVVSDKAETNIIIEENVTEISNRLNQLKEKYREVEEEYQNKKLQDYPVDGIIYDSLKESHNYILEAQSYYFNGEFKKAKTNIEVTEESLGKLSDQLKNLQKKKEKFSDKFKNNMLYVGSIAAALISTVTAITLIRSHVNKKKLMELKEKAASAATSAATKFKKPGDKPGKQEADKGVEAIKPEDSPAAENKEPQKETVEKKE